MMYKESDFLKRLAQQVISERPRVQHLDDPELRIAYLESDKEKKKAGRPVFADCEKVKDKMKAVMPYDFVITFYTVNCAGMDGEQLETLMYHELLHVGWDGESCSIVPHDVQDFREILQDKGIDWSKER